MDAELREPAHRAERAAAAADRRTWSGSCRR